MGTIKKTNKKKRVRKIKQTNNPRTNGIKKREIGRASCRERV